MKKWSKKITTIAGTVTLVVGLMALPALASTTQEQSSAWVNQMQNFMQQTFTSGQHQTLMNSAAMQDLMNSHPDVKAQMGQDNLDKMNQFMNQFGENMMNGSGAASSGSSMMNGRATTNNQTMMNL